MNTRHFYFLRTICAGIISILWMICSLKTATAQSASPETATLTIHITGKEYNALNLIFVSEEARDYICRGTKTGEGSWSFTYPKNIYSKHGHVKLSVKEEIPDRRIQLRTFLYERPIISENFGIPIGNREITLIFYKNVDMPAQFKKGSADMFHVKDPDFEIFCGLRYFFLVYDYPTSQFLSETLKAIREHPNSHYLPYCIWYYRKYYESKKDMLKLYKACSEQAKNSYYGKKTQQWLLDNHYTL